jgi:hypothetical protein
MKLIAELMIAALITLVLARRDIYAGWQHQTRFSPARFD